MMIDTISAITPGQTASPGKVASSAAAASPTAHAFGELRGENDFASLIGNAIAGVAGQLRRAEAVSIAGVEGTAATQDVVEQVMAAEQTLQVAIAVRDKIVAAYLEIGRMAI